MSGVPSPTSLRLRCNSLTNCGIGPGKQFVAWLFALITSVILSGKQGRGAIVSCGVRMGNFYTNITLRSTYRQALIEHMRAQSRRCFISPAHQGFTTIYDRLCEEQDLTDLEALATNLSSRFNCTALAVLNHDDDVLWIGLARDGKWLTTYQSDQSLSGSAWRLAQEFKIMGLLPLVWFLMRWPFFLFEIWRHAALASVLGIPKATVGLGYEYLSRGERPAGAGQFESI